jgi:Family of unknown function (DUF5685)
MLRRSGFPVDALRRLQDRQDEREAKPITLRRNPAAELRRLASPTAEATAMFFAHGARAVGRPESAGAMRRLGYDFGRLVYLLDAFEDYEKDWRQGEFNALRAAFGWMTESLTAEQRGRVAEGLPELRRRIADRISTLPIPESYARLFSERLDYNLSRKIGKSLPVLNFEAQTCRKRGLTLSARWKNAISFAKRMMSQEERVCSKGAWLKAYFAFISALAVVFLVPPAASRLRTWQDCWSLGFNLMFLSALPGAVLAAVTPTTDPAMNNKKGKRECDCCECCRDCCGEGCEAGIEGCGECCCDKCCGHCHCNCCDGCCDSCGCDCGSP